MDRPRFSKCNPFQFAIRILYLYGLFQLLSGLMQRIGLIAVVVALLAASSRAGELDNLRSEVYHSDFPNQSEEKYDSRACRDDSCQPCNTSSGAGDDLIGNLMGAAILSPFWFTKGIIEGNDSKTLYFPSAPYLHTDGSMVEAINLEHFTWHSWQASVEFGSDFDDVQRYGARLLLSTVSRWDLDASFDEFIEALPVTGNDSLFLGDVNLVYRFAQNEFCQIRSGLGMNYLIDDAGRVGFNFTIGAEFYPRKPWTIFSNLDWGTLGHAPYIHVNAGIGVVRDRVEFFGGYDYREIGDAEFSGPMMGLRFYF